MGNYCEMCDNKVNGGIALESRTLVPFGYYYFCSHLCLFNWAYKQVGTTITVEIRGETANPTAEPAEHLWVCIGDAGIMCIKCKVNQNDPWAKDYCKGYRKETNEHQNT